MNLTRRGRTLLETVLFLAFMGGFFAWAWHDRQHATVAASPVVAVRHVHTRALPPSREWVLEACREAQGQPGDDDHVYYEGRAYPCLERRTR